MIILTTLLTANAQDFERIAPKTLPKTESQAPTQNRPQLQMGNDKILVKKLKGIVLLKSAKEIKKEGLGNAKGVSAPQLPMLQTAEFKEKIQPFLNQPASLKSLSLLASAIIVFYQENDRPVVDVSIPEQDVTSGVVQLIVLEGRLAQVKSEGGHWFDNKRIREEIQLRPNDPIEESELMEDLRWINNNPFRQVQAVFSPGAKRGQSDIILRITDRFPVRFYGGYEDSGNDLTGDERFLLGVNWGNAFFADHQLNYQFTGDSHFNKIRAHSGSYVIPLPWRHRLTFFGSYSETLADMTNPLFNLRGKSWQTSARYTVPLPIVGPYSHEWTGGFDFKQSNNNLEFGGAEVFNTTTDIAQCFFDYTSSLQDPYGKTGFDASIVYSPGRLTDGNGALSFESSRRSAQPDYKYGKFSIERLTKLLWNFTWTAKGLYQISDGNLLGSEQLGLGGYSSVRGYDEREANGDEGYLFSTEIRAPPLTLISRLEIEKLKDQLQFLGFFDYGQTRNRILLSGEDPHILLASAGPGVRYSVNPYLTVRFDYGWQLYDTGLNQRYNSRGHLGVVLAY